MIYYYNQIQKWDLKNDCNRTLKISMVMIIMGKFTKESNFGIK